MYNCIAFRQPLIPFPSQDLQSKSTTETPEQCVESVQVNNKNTRTLLFHQNDIVLVFLLLHWKLGRDFTNSSGVSIFDFEQTSDR